MESYSKCEVIFVLLSESPFIACHVKSILFLYVIQAKLKIAIGIELCQVYEHMLNLQANSVSFKIFTDTN